MNTDTEIVDNEETPGGAYTERMHVRIEIDADSAPMSTAAGTSGDMVDISPAGLGFVSKKHIPPEPGVSMTFSLPDKNDEPFVFNVRGNIVHSTYVEKHQGYLNGFEFSGLTLPQAEVLVHFIRKQIDAALQNMSSWDEAAN
jgi:c-di-GMP-binding flagellar brake protein YcgR